MQRHTITLDHPADWFGFHRRTRALVLNVPHEGVDWRCQLMPPEDLFDAVNPGHNALPPPTPMRPPARCPRLCAPVRQLSHCDPACFALMYRLLWRMARGGDMARAARHDRWTPTA